MRVVDYVILYAEGNDDMTKEVLAYIADGWEPQGGILVGSATKYIQGGGGVPGLVTPHVTFFQAMVKREARGSEG